MAGVFRVSVVGDDDKNGTDFHYEPIPDATEPSLEEALAFRDEVTRAHLRIKSLLISYDVEYYRSPTYRKYYMGLFRAATSGLAPPQASLIIGRSALRQVERGFVAEQGIDVRRRFIRALSLVDGPVIFLGLALGLIVHLYLANLDSIHKTGDFIEFLKLLESASFVVLGIAISMWVSAVLKNQHISWDTITFFDAGQFPPILRLALVCGLAFILSVMLLVKWVTLGVGPATLNDFPGSPLLSIIIGLVCGLAEDRVSKLVISRFTELPESKPGTRPNG